MKKALSLFLSVVMIALCSSIIVPAVNDGSQVSAVAADEVAVNVNEARFLNMLNHNFVYNSDFDNVDTIINNSILNLLDLRDQNNEDFIAEDYVKGFVKDMYGIDIVDMSALNAEFPHIDGFVYIIPRGYTTYNHDIVSIEQNEDGSFTVVSDVTVSAHDDEPKTKKAVSLFVKNDTSSFGYNMIYCNIVEKSNDI
ncbi:MAG: hypothetical protein Q4B40_05175 [Clostridia bacterium]|nr:hypothetical protein [Clostridia bacterium]